MKRIALFAGGLALVAMAPAPARASCPGSSAVFRTSIVTYVSLNLPAFSPDSRCTVAGGVCQIRLRGVLHWPLYLTQVGQPVPQFPAVVWNHGSEETFTAATKGCALATYLVPKGYIVFVPFRRGHGEDDAGPDPDPNKSTGTYIEDEVAACPTSDPSCTRTQLLTDQADQEVAAAYEYLKARADVKDDAIAVMGSSYGGRVTVLFNRIDHGQQATVAFSPASQAWSDAQTPTSIQTALLDAAADAQTPTFYLQAKWDYDTRPTIDLAYAQHYGGSDPQHGRRFMASIYEYPKPPDLNPDPDVEELDYQSVHTGFASDTARWGPAVLDFIKRYGVE